jgi:hypothetical protein
MYPEPWHLSYASSARVALEAFDIDVLARGIREADGMLALEMLPEIARRHVLGVDVAWCRVKSISCPELHTGLDGGTTAQSMEQAAYRMACQGPRFVADA